MKRSDQASPAEALKTCCADLYSRDGIRLLLGETFHPGGLALTARVAELLGLEREDRVLDVAAGLGASARHLAGTIGCRVDALDLSTPNLVRARQGTEVAGLDRAVRVLAGDAEALPYRDRVFDAVLSECALSTFPDKIRTAHEIFRVLRPGGRLGLTDMTGEPETLPGELRDTLLRAACLADARTAEGYRSVLLQAGFGGVRGEEHPEALAALLGQVRARLRLGRLAGLAGLLPAGALDAADRIVDQIDGLVRAGRIGYVVVVAERPDEGGSGSIMNV